METISKLRQLMKPNSSLTIPTNYLRPHTLEVPALGALSTAVIVPICDLGVKL